MGLWRGLTGRLRLSVSGDSVTGEYDWLGYEYSGSLKGRFIDDAIAFDWSWTISGATGSGLFYRRSSDSLTGGWWFKYEEIDAKQLLAAKALPPQHWNFVKSTSVSLSGRVDSGNVVRVFDGMKSKVGMIAASSFLVPPEKKSSRNRLCPCGSGKRQKHCCAKRK